MKVIIKESVHEYVSDFDNGWEFSRGDYFKYPVAIGVHSCYIKRFEKKPENISGWKLILDLKEKNVPNLIRIYDVVKKNENDKIIYYVFFECIEGKALHELVSKKIVFNLEKLTDDIFSALQNLHTRSYWFPDFCEPNIFGSKNGHFLLTDLDGAHPLSYMPNDKMPGNKEYWGFVIKFCKDILDHRECNPSQINGASFNYLQATFLILRLKFFYDGDEIAYDSVEFKNQLPHYLNSTSPSFKKIFDKVFQNENYLLEGGDIIEIKNLIRENIIALPGSAIKKLVNEPISLVNDTRRNAPARNARIIDFTLSNYIEKKGNEFTVASEETFILTWDIRNAQKAALYKNGQLYREFNNDENNIELKEVAYDGKEKLIEYTLVASGSNDLLESVEKTSLSVKVIVAKTVVAEEPAIEFSVNNYLEKGLDYYVVESGKPFTLSWNVNDAREISIEQNGKHFKAINSSEKSMEITEEVHEGNEKKINYTLSALSARSSETSSRSLSIIVKKPGRLQPVIKYFRSDKYAVRNGRSFVLNWSIQNVTHVELYINGVPNAKFTKGETRVTKQANFDAAAKTISCKLIAYNGEQKLESNSIEIRQNLSVPTKPGTYLKWIGIPVLALVIIGLLIKMWPVPTSGKPVILEINPQTFYGSDPITIKGKNFPTSPNATQVVFNKKSAVIQSQSEDVLVVNYPPSADPSFIRGAVRVGIIINKDTLYAAKTLFGKYVDISDLDMKTIDSTVLVNDSAARKRTSDSIALVEKAIKKKEEREKALAAEKAKINAKAKEDSMRKIDATNVAKLEEEKKRNAQEEKKRIWEKNKYDLVLVTSTFKQKTLGGVKNVKITVTNNSDYYLDNIVVKVRYLKGKKEKKNTTLTLLNISPHSAATLETTDGPGDAIQSGIDTIKTKEFD